jgi:hypothetical protein
MNATASPDDGLELERIAVRHSRLCPARCLHFPFALPSLSLRSAFTLPLSIRPFPHPRHVLTAAL